MPKLFSDCTGTHSLSPKVMAYSTAINVIRSVFWNWLKGQQLDRSGRYPTGLSIIAPTDKILNLARNIFKRVDPSLKNLEHIIAIGRKRRHRFTGDFRPVVSAAKRNRRVRARQYFESEQFFLIHWTALHFQTPFRSLRQTRMVFRINCAEVTLKVPFHQFLFCLIADLPWWAT